MSRLVEEELCDFLEQEYSQPETEFLPALKVAPIHGVLPFGGHRNPLTRSNTARKVSTVIATAATDWVPQVYHFDSEGEFVVALEAVLDPDFYGLEVQLPPIPHGRGRTKKKKEHHFDLRLTFSDGYRRTVYVRNGESLAKRETQEEIDGIFKCIPKDFADDAIVVNTDHYTRAYRDNLRRIWHLSKKEDTDADEHVERVARSTSYWLLRDLIGKCDLPPARCWQAAMRLVGRRTLCADWHSVINLHSRVKLGA